MRFLRVLLDANLFISFLLVPSGRSVPVRIVEAAIAGRFALLLTDEILTEIRRKITTKPYLAGRISLADANAVLVALETVGELVSATGREVPVIGRDRKDDHVLIGAINGHADFLVSGDKDLLVLGQVDGVQIVSPADFLALLEDPAGRR